MVRSRPHRLALEASVSATRPGAFCILESYSSHYLCQRTLESLYYFRIRFCTRSQLDTLGISNLSSRRLYRGGPKSPLCAPEAPRSPSPSVSLLLETVGCVLSASRL